jgi:hypothetical protein
MTMSIERQKITSRFDFDMHGAIKVLAEIDGLTMEKWIERETCRAVQKRVHEANVLSASVARLKTSGSNGESVSGFGGLE